MTIGGYFDPWPPGVSPFNPRVREVVNENSHQAAWVAENKAALEAKLREIPPRPFNRRLLPFRARLGDVIEISVHRWDYEWFMEVLNPDTGEFEDHPSGLRFATSGFRHARNLMEINNTLTVVNDGEVISDQPGVIITASNLPPDTHVELSLAGMFEGAFQYVFARPIPVNASCTS